MKMTSSFTVVVNVCRQQGTDDVLVCLLFATHKLLVNIVQFAMLASYPGHSQILSLSRGEKSGEGLGAKLRHGPEMVDLVST